MCSYYNHLSACFLVFGSSDHRNCQFFPLVHTTAEEAFLFIDGGKVPAEVSQHFSDANVKVCSKSRQTLSLTLHEAFVL